MTVRPSFFPPSPAPPQKPVIEREGAGTAATWLVSAREGRSGDDSDQVSRMPQVLLSRWVASSRPRPWRPAEQRPVLHVAGKDGVGGGRGGDSELRGAALRPGMGP